MEFFICPCNYCEIQLSFEHQRSFINHIREHIQLNTLQLPFICKQNNCIKTFIDLKIYSNHLNKCHKKISENIVSMNNRQIKKAKLNSSNIDSDINTSEIDNNISNEGDINNGNLYECVVENNVVNELKAKAFDLINHFRSKNQLSAVLLNEIIDLFGDFIFELVDIIKHEVVQRFLENDDKKMHLEIFLKKVNRPFEYLSSTYKQQVYLEESGFFIGSKSIYLGTREDISMKSGTAVVIQKNLTFEYVSIYETIKILLENKEFKAELIKFSNNKNDYYHQHSLFKEKKNLQILLYYDDLEMCNGLGDVSGVYKCGMFYFTLGNLTRRHYSNLKNIFLVAICHSNDLKTYGYNKVLQIIMKDIKKIETIGIRVGTEIFFGTIAQCLGDNLGIHQIFGIQQKFWGQRICHLCNAGTESSQLYFNEKDFKIYDKNDYDKLVEEDIFKKTALNDSVYFHILDNYGFDLTHDLWLGVVPLELSLLLTNLIENKLITIELINSRINKFNYGLSDIKNKPNVVYMYDKMVKVKQKAAKMACLFKLLPFIIGDKIPFENENWSLFIKLSEIIEILYSEETDELTCSNLESLIAGHHSFFRRIYPTVNLKKKHHNMIHYGSAIRKIGSMVNYCTLRFEAKHGFFKTVQKTSNNSKNIPLTLARKHQICLATNLISSKLLNKNYEVVDGNEIKISELNFIIRQELAKIHEFSEHDKILIAETIMHYGYMYKKNHIIFISKEKKNFCCICKFIVYKNKIYISGNEYKAKCFSIHFQAYEVACTNKIILVDIDDVYIFNALSFYNSLDGDDKIYVRAFNF